MNPKVEEYFSKVKKWNDELQRLRQIILDCGLTEEYKWRNPCYTFQDNNILFLGELKDSCVLSFIKGSLLSDTNKILIQQTENSQSVRILRFTSVKEILEIESVLKAYIFEALEVDKAGLKVAYKKADEYDFPDELVQILSKNKSLETKFQALTPGRQKGYLLHFTAAKQSETRISRIEKCIPRILNGKGLLDCVCGHSKKMPSCDGSHKFFRDK